MPMIPIADHLSGPIPGENYTSDTKNYPWHRPPDHTDIDSAIIAGMKQLTSKQGTYGLLNSLQLGVTVVQASTMFVISGIGAGKWAVDHAILLAGPFAKIMQIMADGAKIKYTMGLEGDPIPTSSYYNDVKSIDQESVTFAQEAARKNIDEVLKRPVDNPVDAAGQSPVDSGQSTPVSSGFAAKPTASNTSNVPSAPSGGVSGGYVNPNTFIRRELPRNVSGPGNLATLVGAANGQ